MSFLLRTSRFAAARPVCAPARTFGSSTVRALKESDRDNPNYEKHKQDQLQKQKEGKGHWKEELASDSEEAVAADRHDNGDHSQDGIKELQNKTAEHAEKKHKSGTSHKSPL